jgi:hypothetical protein
MALTVPEPTKSWTESHKENDLLEGVVLSRESKTAKSTGNDFDILTVETDTGSVVEVMTGRADLRKFVEQRDPQPGDRIALKFWGMAGERFTYTGAIEKATKPLQSVSDASPPSDADAPPADGFDGFGA